MSWTLNRSNDMSETVYEKYKPEVSWLLINLIQVLYSGV